MKVIYEFDPYEDKEELKMIQRASDYHSVLWDVTGLIRDYHKYHETEEDELKNLKDLLNKIERELEGYGYWEQD